MNTEKLTPYKGLLLRHRLNLIDSEINYFEGLMRLDRRQAIRLEDLQRQRQAVSSEFDKATDLKHLNFTRVEVLNALRKESIERRERAIDFKENPYIKIPNLRKAVTTANLLKDLEPKLEIYSLHWLCSRNTIRL